MMLSQIVRYHLQLDITKSSSVSSELGWDRIRAGQAEKFWGFDRSGVENQVASLVETKKPIFNIGVLQFGSPTYFSHVQIKEI